jgi:hypothetical protein
MWAEAPPQTPPVVVQAAGPRRHVEGSAVAASQDEPLDLVKGARRESALYRRIVFVTTSVAWTAAPDGTERYRWSDKAFVQRELCLTSITGLFACSTPETEPLTETIEGEAPAAGDAAPEADAALSSFIARLKGRSDAIFADDRRDHLAPLLKASGVKVAPPRPAGPRARRGPAARGGSSG